MVPRRTKRRIAFALAALVLSPILVALALPRTRTRLQVSYQTFRLGSADPAVRDEAALRLLAIGRPAIDEVYPRLVATYVGALATGRPQVLVLTGKVVQRDRETGRHDVKPRALLRPGGGYDTSYVKAGVIFEVLREAKRATKVFGRDDSTRELIVFAVPRWSFQSGVSSSCSGFWRQEDGTTVKVDVELVVPLDDDLSPAVVEAVRDAVAH
jgi:hypothetical protein